MKDFSWGGADNVVFRGNREGEQSSPTEYEWGTVDN